MKNKYDGSWTEFAAMTIATLLVAGLLLGVWVGGSYFEAKAFNASTGKNISTWDAMWIELRVQDNAKDE